MRKAVFLTGHFPGQGRRSSLHWVGDHLRADGWHLTFVTVGFSWLSRIFSDRRLERIGEPPATGLRRLEANLDALFLWSPIHPFSTGISSLDRAAAPAHHAFPLFWRRHLAPVLTSADLVIVESGPPVMLGRDVARLAPQASRIYRVNDDLALLNAPPVLQSAEIRQSRYFTRISSASRRLLDRFPEHPNRTLDSMGVPLAELADPGPSPFDPRRKIEAVCAGTTQIDLAAIVRTATDRPDWRLHILGALPQAECLPRNVVLKGECSFSETVRHIAHADVGLAPYLDRPGVEYQAQNSNRVLLYRHFGIPVLGPSRLADPDLPQLVRYGPQSYEICEAWKRRRSELPDWSELARRLSGDQNGVTDPPLLVDTVPATA